MWQKPENVMLASQLFRRRQIQDAVAVPTTIAVFEEDVIYVHLPWDNGQKQKQANEGPQADVFCLWILLLPPIGKTI